MSPPSSGLKISSKKTHETGSKQSFSTMKLRYVPPETIFIFQQASFRRISDDRTLQGNRLFPVPFDAVLHQQSVRLKNDDNSHGLIQDIISGITEKRQ
jgi:hypothetical protein